MIEFTILVAILIIGIYLIRQSRKKDPRKIFDVYSRPGKWFYLKYMLMFSILTLRRVKNYFRKRAFIEETKKLDTLQTLSEHKLAFDAVFFHAVSQNGIYLCTGTERRHQGVVNGLLYIVLPYYGILESEKLPSTKLKADPVALYTQDCYSAEGISFTPLEPMRRWKVSFSGKLRQRSNPENVVSVELDAIWSSDYPWFFFEFDVAPKVLATAFARETWSRNYFRSLKEAHQTHYEQMGFLNGTLEVNGKSISLTHVDSFRDHSFGLKRDWSLMYRYIYHVIHLSDKKRISIGVVSQPCTSSYLEMGYVCYPEGRIDPIQECDLLLYQHGENGHLPDALCFTFHTEENIFEVKIKYQFDAEHFKGTNEECKMCERFFTCDVNGIDGRGISEWQYNVRFDKHSL